MPINPNRQPVIISHLVPEGDVSQYRGPREVEPYVEWEITEYATEDVCTNPSTRVVGIIDDITESKTIKLIRCISPELTSPVDEIILSSHIHNVLPFGIGITFITEDTTCPISTFDEGMKYVNSNFFNYNATMSVTLVLKPYAYQQVIKYLNRKNITYDYTDTRRVEEKRPCLSIHIAFLKCEKNTGAIFSEKNFLNLLYALKEIVPFSQELSNVIKTLALTTEQIASDGPNSFYNFSLIKFGRFKVSSKAKYKLENLYSLGRTHCPFLGHYMNSEHDVTDLSYQPALYNIDEVPSSAVEQFFEAVELKDIKQIKTLIEEYPMLVFSKDWEPGELDIFLIEEDMSLYDFILFLREELFIEYEDFFRSVYGLPNEFSYEKFYSKVLSRPGISGAVTQPLLHQLISCGQIDEVKSYLSENPSEINRVSIRGNSPFLTAVQAENKPIMKELVKRGAKIEDYIDKPDRYSSDFDSVSDTKLLHYLFKLGFDPCKYLLLLDEAIRNEDLYTVEKFFQYSGKRALFLPSRTAAKPAKSNNNGEITLSIAFDNALNSGSRCAMKIAWLILDNTEHLVYAGPFYPYNESARKLESMVEEHNGFALKKRRAPLLRLIFQETKMLPGGDGYVCLFNIDGDKEHELYGKILEKKVISTACLDQSERQQIHAMVNQYVEMCPSLLTSNVSHYIADRIPFQRAAAHEIIVWSINKKVISIYSYCYYRLYSNKIGPYLVFSGKLGIKTSGKPYRDLRLVGKFYVLPLSIKEENTKSPIFVINTFLKPGFGFFTLDTITVKLAPKYHSPRINAVSQQILHATEQESLPKSWCLKTQVVIRHDRLRETTQTREFSSYVGPADNEKLVGIFELTQKVVDDLANKAHAFIPSEGRKELAFAQRFFHATNSRKTIQEQQLNYSDMLNNHRKTSCQNANTNQPLRIRSRL